MLVLLFGLVDESFFSSIPAPFSHRFGLSHTLCCWDTMGFPHVIHISLSEIFYLDLTSFLLYSVSDDRHWGSFLQMQFSTFFYQTFAICSCGKFSCIYCLQTLYFIFKFQNQDSCIAPWDILISQPMYLCNRVLNSQEMLGRLPAY